MRGSIFLAHCVFAAENQSNNQSCSFSGAFQEDGMSLGTISGNSMVWEAAYKHKPSPLWEVPWAFKHKKDKSWRLNCNMRSALTRSRWAWVEKSTLGASRRKLSNNCTVDSNVFTFFLFGSCLGRSPGGFQTYSLGKYFFLWYHLLAPFVIPPIWLCDLRLANSEIIWEDGEACRVWHTLIAEKWVCNLSGLGSKVKVWSLKACLWS